MEGGLGWIEPNLWGQSKDSWPANLKHSPPKSLDAVDWPCV